MGGAAVIIICVSRYLLRLIAAIVLTVISLTLLVWSLWPYNRTLRHELVPPTQMQVPTRNSLLLWDRLV